MPTLSAQERYTIAAHRMQSAVAYDLMQRLALDVAPHFLDPVQINKAIKDVRVGVNAVASDASAIAALLIQKGIITEAEFHDAIALAMEREADDRVAEVCERYALPPGTNFA